ncbi:hypothetical protein [Zavarzinella formosa]|uniref:hypothetical protein n=1 Tax=Zavarzinella formosa TaxID=360055 RepID=UPI000318CF1D|nr:hypothetical protein [Zavarzinella formosa]
MQWLSRTAFVAAALVIPFAVGCDGKMTTSTSAPKMDKMEKGKMDPMDKGKMDPADKMEKDKMEKDKMEKDKMTK